MRKQWRPGVSFLETLGYEARCGCVSIVHECGESCKFIEQQTTRTVERETIEENTRLIYKHDFDNDFYVLNVFCMNQ